MPSVVDEVHAQGVAVYSAGYTSCDLLTDSACRLSIGIHCSRSRRSEKSQNPRQHYGQVDEE